MPPEQLCLNEQKEAAKGSRKEEHTSICCVQVHCPKPSTHCWIATVPASLHAGQHVRSCTGECSALYVLLAVTSLHKLQLQICESKILQHVVPYASHKQEQKLA